MTTATMAWVAELSDILGEGSVLTDPQGLLNPGKVLRRAAVADLGAVGELTGQS